MTDSSLHLLAADTVLNAVAKFYGLDIPTITSRSRKDSIVWPRMIAMSITRELTQLTLTEVANIYGCKDHGTVTNACHTVENRIQTDPKFDREMTMLAAAMIKELRRELLSSEIARILT